MPANLPSVEDPKARKVYLVLGDIVGYPLWYPLWERAGTITGRVSRPARFREPPTAGRPLPATGRACVNDVISGQVL